MNEQEPIVYIGIITSNVKLYCLTQFIRGLKLLTYKNLIIQFADNSPKTNSYSMAEAIRELGFNVQEIERPAKVRQALIDSRNWLLKDAKEKKADYFLSLESDVIPPPDIIERLLAHNKEIVSAVYCNNKSDLKEGIIAEGAHKGKPGVATSAYIIPMAWDWGDPNLKEANILRPFNIQELLPSRLMEVCTIGLGCVLIDIKCVEDFQFSYDPRYESCDDQFFCIDMFKKGHNIWLDTSTWCRHLHVEWDAQIKRDR